MKRVDQKIEKLTYLRDELKKYEKAIEIIDILPEYYNYVSGLFRIKTEKTFSMKFVRWHGARSGVQEIEIPNSFIKTIIELLELEQAKIEQELNQIL